MSSMTASQIIKELEKFPGDLPVFYKYRPSIGTVGEIFYVYQGEYSFFGKVLPCIIVDTVQNEGATNWLPAHKNSVD